MSEFCEHIEAAIGLQSLTREQAIDLGAGRCPICKAEKKGETAHVSPSYSFNQHTHYWDQMICGALVCLIVGGALYALAH